MKATNTADLIAKLKAVRAEYGYSYQDIIDMVEAHGEHTSLSSVRRVFSEGSEDRNFRYEDVIRPIAKALLMGIEAPQQGSPHQAERYYSQLEALESAINMKNEEIAELTQRLTATEHQRDEAVWKLQYIEAAQDRSSKLRTLLFGVIAIIFLLISSVDITHGQIGFIQYETIGVMEVMLLALLACLVAYIVYELIKTFRQKE